MGSRPLRAAAAEAAVGQVDAAEVGRLAVADLDNVPSDLHGSAEYRAQVGAVVVERAVTRALEEARRG
jgi:carbon-monoxide dehydrogenase medium subunit